MLEEMSEEVPLIVATSEIRLEGEMRVKE